MKVDSFSTPFKDQNGRNFRRASLLLPSRKTPLVSLIDEHLRINDPTHYFSMIILVSALSRAKAR